MAVTNCLLKFDEVVNFADQGAGVVEIQNLPDEDKKHILYALDGLLQNVRTKLAFEK